MRLILLEPLNIAGVTWAPTARVGKINREKKTKRFMHNAERIDFDRQ